VRLGRAVDAVERAGFEVRRRASHPLMAGCPIETPEGPNIGLINSLALFARTQSIRLPGDAYRKLENGKVTDQIDICRQLRKVRFVIAQANAIWTRRQFPRIWCRVATTMNFAMSTPDKVQYMDVARGRSFPSRLR